MFMCLNDLCLLYIEFNLTNSSNTGSYARLYLQLLGDYLVLTITPFLFACVAGGFLGFLWQAIYGLPLCYGEKVVSLSSHVTVND